MLIEIGAIQGAVTRSVFYPGKLINYSLSRLKILNRKSDHEANANPYL